MNDSLPRSYTHYILDYFLGHMGIDLVARIEEWRQSHGQRWHTLPIEFSRSPKTTQIVADVVDLVDTLVLPRLNFPIEEYEPTPQEIFVGALKMLVLHDSQSSNPKESMDDSGQHMASLKQILSTIPQIQDENIKEHVFIRMMKTFRPLVLLILTLSTVPQREKSQSQINFQIEDLKQEVEGVSKWISSDNSPPIDSDILWQETLSAYEGMTGWVIPMEGCSSKTPSIDQGIFRPSSGGVCKGKSSCWNRSDCRSLQENVNRTFRLLEEFIDAFQEEEKKVVHFKRTILLSMETLVKAVMCNGSNSTLKEMAIELFRDLPHYLPNALQSGLCNKIDLLKVLTQFIMVMGTAFQTVVSLTRIGINWFWLLSKILPFPDNLKYASVNDQKFEFKTRCEYLRDMNDELGCLALFQNIFSTMSAGST